MQRASGDSVVVIAAAVTCRGDGRETGDYFVESCLQCYQYRPKNDEDRDKKQYGEHRRESRSWNVAFGRRLS